MLTTEKREWFSQLGQDKLVYELLGNLKGGYFVDLASNDATEISNSYALETFHGWNGLCVEANAKYWARLAFRKCEVVGAVVGQNRMEEIEFNFGAKSAASVLYHPRGFEDGMMGGIVNDAMDNTVKSAKADTHILVKRYTVPLKEIFERHGAPKTIDYFSLDVKGAETYVMSGFPFREYKFRTISIERP